MSSLWAVLAYSCSVALALSVLYFFHARPWYWHAGSVLLALVLGLVPIPARWNAPHFDILIGSLFLFLLFWGAGAALLGDGHHHHRPRHA